MAEQFVSLGFNETFKARFKRRILHAPNRLAELTACKMDTFQLNASSVEYSTDPVGYTTEVRQMI